MDENERRDILLQLDFRFSSLDVTDGAGDLSINDGFRLTQNYGRHAVHGRLSDASLYGPDLNMVVRSILTNRAKNL